MALYTNFMSQATHNIPFDGAGSAYDERDCWLRLFCVVFIVPVILGKLELFAFASVAEDWGRDVDNAEKPELDGTFIAGAFL